MGATDDLDPPIKALFVYNCNPAAVAPDQSSVRAGLAREDLLTVVLEHFQTDTADYADYLLPATTQAEHWDLQRMYGHHYLALNRPAIPPVGEARPNSAIFRGLAQAMGYTDTGFYEDIYVRTPDGWRIKQRHANPDPRPSRRAD
jgi:anaerobic selenocysteine-containing dehydrogenase